MIDMDFEDLELEGGSAFVGWISGYENAFAHIYAETPWSLRSMVMYGRRVEQPRLTAWYGDPGCSYAYSGVKNEPKPWTDYLSRLRAELQNALEVEFNSVLLNLYRDGSDSVAFHADNERELGAQPLIASLSFGAPRKFTFRHRRREFPDRTLELKDGMLLIMMGDTQTNWLHSIPKDKSKEPRLNLTFRKIVID